MQSPPHAIFPSPAPAAHWTAPQTHVQAVETLAGFTSLQHQPKTLTQVLVTLGSRPSGVCTKESVGYSSCTGFQDTCGPQSQMVTQGHCGLPLCCRLWNLCGVVSGVSGSLIVWPQQMAHVSPSAPQPLRL